MLPPDWTVPVYIGNPADVVERPLVAELQLSSEREADARLMFKKSGEGPRILIVTDKLLTGYDAPLLYCMYLDKPMRDHTLLQAIARVNRPHVDAGGERKRIGLVVDFVGVLRELKKALRFDSDDVSGVIEDLELMLASFLEKIETARAAYLDDAGERGPDEHLEKVVYGRFLDQESRTAFFQAYKEVEALWEILSPSPELRDHIDTYKRLAQLYAAVRNAYAPQVGFVADLAHKTSRLVQEGARQEGLGRLTKSVTFDLETLEALRGEPGSDEAESLQSGAWSARGIGGVRRYRSGARPAQGAGPSASWEGPGRAEGDGDDRDGPARRARQGEGKRPCGPRGTVDFLRGHSPSTGG